MYTVKQLATIAGITPRALHYYDEIGLLKPSQVGENGYRYYDDGSLLRLQQILLYRELDMPLESIRRLLGEPDFDVLSALENHKAGLRRRITQLEVLVSTVDHTIRHLKGVEEMSQKQMFEGFNEEQIAQYEQEAMQIYDPEIVKASYRKWKGYTQADKRRIGEEGNAIYAGLVEAMPNGPASPEAQALIERWRRHMDYFWTPNLDQLLGISSGYVDDPRFRANFDKIHPKLAEFVREAVKIYVEGKR